MSNEPENQPADTEAHREELQALLDRAQEGDARELPLLREALDANPGIWEAYGDLGRQAEDIQIQLVAGTNVLMHECLTRKLEAFKEELLEAGASPLEQLLVQRVAATWMQVQHADAASAQATDAKLTPAQHNLLQSRQSMAQKRHLAAIKTLATVRKLLKPALSPLELAKHTVAETSASDAATRRARAGSPAGGVPVSN